MRTIIISMFVSLVCGALIGCNGDVDKPARDASQTEGTAPKPSSIEREWQPTGEHAEIDTRLALQTIESLKQPKGHERSKVVDRIIAEPEKYAPPVLYSLSSILLQEGRKDDAMFWFYAGQLRGRIDANLCADKSARQAMSVLNQQFGPQINEYSFEDLDKLASIVEKVLKWEETTDCKYDRRWINLHGMGAFTGDGSVSIPKDQWESVRKTTRDTYRSTFYEAVEMKKQSKP